jgi:hypothetical protein
MKSYAERQPYEYFATLKRMHDELRKAFARKQVDEIARIQREIAIYRWSANSTYGKSS